MADISTSSGSFDPASALAEQIALSNSSTVFVYDLAEEVGFGSYASEGGKNRHVLSMQTRAGAGANIAGRISESRAGAQKDAVITAFNTPEGVAAMAASLYSLPGPLPESRLVIQVPALTPIGQNMELSPTTAPLNAVFGALPESFVVMFSSTPQELLDLTLASYTLSNYHVIHIFDHFNAGRELGHALVKRDLNNRQFTEPREALKALGYDCLEYIGSGTATDVLVMANGPLSAAVKAFVKRSPSLGLMLIRVLKPLDDALLLSALPESVRTVYVLEEVQAEASQGLLYGEVLATLLANGKARTYVKPVKIMPSFTQKFVASPSALFTYLQSIIVHCPLLQNEQCRDSASKRLLFFGTPSDTLKDLPIRILSSFFGKNDLSVCHLTDYDILSRPGGVVTVRASVGLKRSEYIPTYLDHALEDGQATNFIAILEPSLLKTHLLLGSARPSSVILLFSTWSPAELSSNLPSNVVRAMMEKGVKLYNFNLKALEDHGGGSDASIISACLAFFRLYLGSSANEVDLRKLAHAIFTDVDEGVNLDKLNAKAWSILDEVVLSPAGEDQSELKGLTFNAVRPIAVSNAVSLPGAYLSSWHRAARHILFPDAFESSPGPISKPNPSLRPEISDDTHLVTCTVNRRLTPIDYDRNVFHLEFDTSGTGLKYAIGEALGVHGWNDEKEVLDFCAWYGIDPDLVVTIPVPSVEGRMHSRTVFQALQQQIDLFGKPTKSFYAALAEYATNKIDKLSLQFIGSGEGSATFKKLSEKDTVTFTDILQRYPSARPGVEVLCELIGDIKPRHYSIASAQSVVGDRVDLLVVTVEWSSPSGSPRYGQCTRYLAGLKVGQKVTVSIKPSVMKLPPDDMQPLILAGLGTGAAPFRAFLQHRAMLVAQGKAVGPLYYYFGSRYQSKEYLYGEEIEAFIFDKTITRAGLAFSRDTKKKVYIQHKMSEDAEDLARMLRQNNGVFYLCGPTWPVPDVFEALVGALGKYFGMSEKEAGDYLESLKEEERYVLEVY